MKHILKISILICFLFSLFIIYIKKETIPISLFQIQSGSMMPEINAGEIIFLVKQNEYKQNDIVTYQINNLYFITHRIEEVTNEGYITKGDFNNNVDEKIVGYDEIKGKVIFHSKALGNIYKYRYYIAIILILLLFFVILM